MIIARLVPRFNGNYLPWFSASILFGILAKLGLRKLITSSYSVLPPCWSFRVLLFRLLWPLVSHMSLPLSLVR